MDLTPPPPPDPASENLVSFYGNGEPYPFTLRPDRGACIRRCRRVVCDEKTRTLECQDCKRTIDPWDYLAQWAREGDRRCSALKEMDVTITKKQQEIERLKMDLQNIKQQVRRARGEAHELAIPLAAMADSAARAKGVSPAG